MSERASERERTIELNPRNYDARTRPEGSNQFIGLIRLPNRFPREIIRGILLRPVRYRLSLERRRRREKGRESSPSPPSSSSSSRSLVRSSLSPSSFLLPLPPFRHSSPLYSLPGSGLLSC